MCERGDGAPFDPDSFSTGFKRAVRAAELPYGIRLHDMRHAVATMLLKEGVDPKSVSAMLGHSTVSFTQDQFQHVLKG
jgi:site-specific recombinase XerD